MKRRWALLVVTAVLVALGIAAAAASGTGPHPKRGLFKAGAAVVSFAPPAFGKLKHDPANCATPAGTAYNGKRYFAFEEPYVDSKHDGHYDVGDPYVNCNHDGRWDGDTLGGGGNSPRFYNHIADRVGARALVISNGRTKIAIEVVDNEGLFNVFANRIRAKVRADGYHLSSIQISATHDESAPDTLGLGGVQPVISGTNEYFVTYLVQKAAVAIEQAYRRMVPAHIRYAEAKEPTNLRQCWSSYPFIDNQLMPVMQAVATNGHVIATLASVSQHAETLGFNGGSQKDPGSPTGATLDQENLWVSGDWPYWFRTALQKTYGGVGIEMAGSVGSVETPEVWSKPVPRTPQKFIDESHPAGCRTLFNTASGAKARPLGYYSETKALGYDLAGAVKHALHHGSAWSHTNTIWADTVSICVPVANALFKFAAVAGVFAERPAYGPGCKMRVTKATAGTSIRSNAAAWRIGDAEFIGAPGEVFPFTFFRGPVGPQDMNIPKDAMPPWPLPYMHTPWRFFDGLDNDMIGYIFPQGNDAGVPGQRAENPRSGTDRFGCGHSDDSESVNDKAGNIIGTALVGILAHIAGLPEAVVQGRYVLPDGKLSRNPLGTTDTIKCTRDRHHVRGRRPGSRGMGARPRRDQARGVDGPARPPPDRPPTATRAAGSTPGGPALARRVRQPEGAAESCEDPALAGGERTAARPRFLSCEKTPDRYRSGARRTDRLGVDRLRQARRRRPTNIRRCSAPARRSRASRPQPSERSG